MGLLVGVVVGWLVVFVRALGGRAHPNGRAEMLSCLLGTSLRWWVVVEHLAGALRYRG